MAELQTGTGPKRGYVGEVIGDGVVRFRGAGSTGPVAPFPGYVAQPKGQGLVGDDFPVRPRFSRRGGAWFVELFNTRPASLYATGEQAGPLLRNGTRKVVWNTDSYEYTEKSPGLYQSHPFVLGLRPAPGDGGDTLAASKVPRAFGVIFETTYRCVIDLRNGVGGVAAQVFGAQPAVTVILRETAQEVCAELARMTGFMPMPPLWALGYHQCRYSYEPEARVREVAAGFRSRKIPCDTIWLDIDYMDGYRCFTFDPVKFPDPAGLVEDLHADNFKVVCMIDPGLKVDSAYLPYAQGRDQGHFVKDAAGNEYHGPVWPGESAFPDFTRAGTRVWWGGLYDNLLHAGMDGFWNDMNEPAVFTPSRTMPDSNTHDADAELGGPGDHARYHNIYGMEMVRGTREGVEKLRPERRHFLLSRASFLGGHRYAACWTGDNVANWDHLRWSIPMALNLGLSGQPFVGPDIGGFINDTDPELFARWMGIGALLPFARGHKNKGTKAHEPWALGPVCEEACRVALERRYRLLPYLYTLFHEAATTGIPVVRPLFFADPDDARLRCVDDAFLLGGDVLVKANVSATGVQPACPALEGWAQFEPASRPNAALPELMLRPGAVVPLGPAQQFTGEKPLDPLTLLVALDKDGQASGRLHEDAGDGMGYQKGEFRVTQFRARRDSGGNLGVESVIQGGNWGPVERAVVVVEVGGAKNA